MTTWLMLGAILGCGVGSILRYGLGTLGHPGAFPWPTVAANVLGSALVGAVAAAVLRDGAAPGWLLMFGGGIAGGLSTFSTLAVDAVLLWERQHMRAVATYLLATLVAGVAATAMGWALWSAWSS